MKVNNGAPSLISTTTGKRRWSKGGELPVMAEVFKEACDNMSGITREMVENINHFKGWWQCLDDIEDLSEENKFKAGEILDTERKRPQLVAMAPAKRKNRVEWLLKNA